MTVPQIMAGIFIPLIGIFNDKFRKPTELKILSSICLLTSHIYWLMSPNFEQTK